MYAAPVVSRIRLAVATSLSVPCLAGGLPLLRSQLPLAFRGARERLLLFSPEKRLSQADDGGCSQANDSGQLMSTSGFFSS